jgi:hypothetical protein
MTDGQSSQQMSSTPITHHTHQKFLSKKSDDVNQHGNKLPSRESVLKAVLIG